MTNSTAEYVEESGEMLRRTWQELAIERFATQGLAQRSPEAVLIAAQPGAGKSVLAEAARRAFVPRGGCVSIDPVELMLLHPDYIALANEQPKDVVATLRPECADLAATILDQAARLQRHLVLVCSFDSHADAAVLVQYLKEIKYRVILLALVVPPDVSLGELLRRSEERLELSVAAHWIDPEYHDFVWERWLESLDHLEKAGQVDEFVMLNRDGGCLGPQPTDSTAVTPCSVIIAQALATARSPDSVEHSQHPDQNRVQAAHNSGQDSYARQIASTSHQAMPSRAESPVPSNHPRLQPNSRRAPRIDLTRFSDEQRRRIEQRLEYQRLLRRCAATERGDG